MHVTHKIFVKTAWLLLFIIFLPVKRTMFDSKRDVSCSALLHMLLSLQASYSSYRVLFNFSTYLSRILFFQIYSNGRKLVILWEIYGLYIWLGWHFQSTNGDRCSEISKTNLCVFIYFQITTRKVKMWTRHYSQCIKLFYDLSC